jgi:ligand-binding SRPBCC domain-containing protein
MIPSSTASGRIETPRRPARPRTGLGWIRCDTTVPRSLDETFAFFSDARNLDALTPAWVGFRILTPAPINMRRGTLIDYRIRIHGIPIRWRTEITEWDAPNRFVDIQLKGPYRWWHHEHRFEPCGDGTRIIDEVEYSALLHWISHPLIVERDVGRIFDFRTRALNRILGGSREP